MYNYLFLLSINPPFEYGSPGLFALTGAGLLIIIVMLEQRVSVFLPVKWTGIRRLSFLPERTPMLHYHMGTVLKP